MKVAIILGHCADKQGASSKYGVADEWTFNANVLPLIPHIKGIEIDTYTYDNFDLGYPKTVYNKALELNKKDYDCILELHYNSSNNDLANGTEALYFTKSKKGKELADIYCDVVSKQFNTTNRKAKPLSHWGDRGFASVYYYKAPVIICEPFFGSNKDDSEKFADNHRKYAMCLMETLVSFGVFPDK